MNRYYDFLFNILKIVTIFIKEVEKDLFSISDIIPIYFQTYYDLINLNNDAAKKMAKYFRSCFTATCPLKLTLASFLLTKKGLQYFRENTYNMQIFTNDAIEGFDNFMIQKKYDNNLFQLNHNFFY